MNAQRAGREAAMLLKNSLPSSPKELKAHMRRIERVSSEIHTRHGVAPRSWRVKHLRRWLEHDSKDLSSKTRYNYFLTILKTLEVLQKSKDFKPFLLGSWCFSDGVIRTKKKTGRPMKKCFSFFIE